MTAISNDNSCIVRCQRSRTLRGVKSTKTWRQPSFSSRTKLLTRTSLLVVLVLLSANWMIVEGASFSSSVSSPALAPISSVVNDETIKPQQEEEWSTPTMSSRRPSSSPSQSYTKKTKKHEKKKARSGVLPRSTVDVETGLAPRKHNPKTRKSASPESRLPAAFGLNGQKKSNQKFTEISSTSVSKRKSKKSRTRSTSKTTTKQIAFVCDQSSRKRKHKKSDLSYSSSSATIADETKMKPKVSKRKPHGSTKNSSVNLGNEPNKAHENAERAPRVSSTEANEPGTLSTRKNSNSSSARRSKTKIPSANHKTNSDGLRMNKEKFHKKHKQRSKDTDAGGEAPTATKGTRAEKVIIQATEIGDSSALLSKTTGYFAKSKGPKRKRRRKEIPVSTASGEGVASSTPDSSKYITNGELSASKDMVQMPTETPVDSKHRNKKKRRRNTSSKLDEAGSSSSIEKEEPTSATRTRLSNTQSPVVGVIINSPRVTSDVIDATEAAQGVTNEVSDLSLEAEEKDDLTDNSAGTEVEADTSTKVTTTTVSSPSNNKENRDRNIEEAASMERELGGKCEDLDKRKEEESEDMSADHKIKGTLLNQEEDIDVEEDSKACEEKAPQSDAKALDDVCVSKQKTVDKESIDTIDHEEKGTEIDEEALSSVDIEVVVDESITLENKIDDKKDGIAGYEEVGNETGEDGPQVYDEKVDDEYIVEKTNIVEENEDAIEHDKEKSDVVGKESSGANTTTAEYVKEGENGDEQWKNLNGDEQDRTEVAAEKGTKADVQIVIDESIEEENKTDNDSDDTTDIVKEEPSKVDSDVIEDESIIEEENSDAECQESVESEDDENPSPSRQSSDALYDKENKTRRGVSFHDGSDKEMSSSEESYIDPEQDVVSFIEEVLNENVRSWIEESDSHFENIVNKTRGGHFDNTNSIDNKALESEVMQDNEGKEKNTFDEVSKTSEIAGDVCEANVQDTKGMIEKSKGKFEIIDRKSLEKSEDDKSDAIVSVVTWNLAEDSPSEEDASFIRKFRKNGISPDQGSDLVLISGQECENIKPRRSEGRRSREYRRLMITMLGKGYVPLALHLLGGIQFGLFAKRSFLKEVEDVSVVDVTCGIGNVFHNKGAIAAFVKLKARNDIRNDSDKKRSKSLRMVFVTAHLAAHVKNAEARDSDFWRISSELEAQAPEGFLPRKAFSRESSGSFLFDSVDRVFFCGDLNYRLDLPRELTEHAILHRANQDKGSIKDLLRHDQLIHSMAEGRAFTGFGEGKITFMPTFKYDKESSSYDTSHKQRIPAWTDRVLFQPTDGIRVLDYQSIPGAQSSDHRPVYGTYRIGMEGRVVTPSLRKRKRKRINESTGINYYK